jgi:hypothetical protein
MTHQVNVLLDKTKQNSCQEGTSANLVFNFEDIFGCWIHGKCSTKFLHAYCMEQIAKGFLKEIEEKGQNHNVYSN